MNKFLSQATATLATILFLALHSNAAELSLIEKRLIELDKLNKQAILHDSKTPRNSALNLQEKSNLPEKTAVDSIRGAQESASLSQKPLTLPIEEKHPYTVQISSGRSQAQCFRLAKMLRNAGYPAFTAFLEFRDNTIWHRIFVGSFSNKQKAEATQANLPKEQLPHGLVRSMPFSVQVGSPGTVQSLESLRRELEDMHILPYTSPVENKAETGDQVNLVRLLIGAFETKEDTTALIAAVRGKGLQAQVVSR